MLDAFINTAILFGLNCCYVDGLRAPPEASGLESGAICCTTCIRLIETDRFLKRVDCLDLPSQGDPARGAHTKTRKDNNSSQLTSPRHIKTCEGSVCISEPPRCLL